MNWSPTFKKVARRVYLILTLNEKRVRAKIVLSYLLPQNKLALSWIFKRGEKSNFNYSLTSLNLEHLAQAISVVTGSSQAVIQSYLDELNSDIKLKCFLTSDVNFSNSNELFRFDFARRYGWYALVRSLKPKLVIETGVDQGVGACVISSALIRNLSDGFPGRYLGTEINKNAAKLFISSEYATVGQVVFGDSIETLAMLDEKIDLFINDSDHSSEYEYQEYLTIKSKLSPSGVIIGDNSHVSNALSRYSFESGRKFLFFAEKPHDHWYPGAGIGISFV
jgi:Methyltransferase domain